jgi:hypothetical protein
VAGRTAPGKPPTSPQPLVTRPGKPYLPPAFSLGAAMTTRDAELITEANRLYWETEDSVAEIAEQLELSRRALYDLVEPLPTGASCETCGGPMTFDNRSARSAGHAVCVICRETGATDADQATMTTTETDDEERVLLVGGAALAGAAIGALITFALVSRR